MLSLFNKKIQSLWGLHISDRHLRVAEVTGNTKDWKISKLGRIDIPEGTVEKGIIKNIEVFGSSLAEIKSKAFPKKIDSPYVAVKLAEEHTFFRTIELPDMKPDEIDEAIQWEAESNIPLPLEKVYLSWETLPEKKDKNISILLAATSKDVIDSIISVLDRYNLIPLFIEPESTSLVRGLAETDEKLFDSQGVLILNLKESYTHLIAFEDRVVRLSTILDVCSKNFDKDMEIKLGIKPNEAEEIRKQIGWNEGHPSFDKIASAINPSFVSIKKEIETALSFYHDKYSKPISSILLTGEIKSKWIGFDRILEKTVKIPTRWQNDWNPEKWPQNCPYVDQGKEEYNIVIGLALRKLEGEI